jgi:hypothetical protein
MRDVGPILKSPSTLPVTPRAVSEKVPILPFLRDVEALLEHYARRCIKCKSVAFYRVKDIRSPSHKFEWLVCDVHRESYPMLMVTEIPIAPVLRRALAWLQAIDARRVQWR